MLSMKRVVCMCALVSATWVMCPRMQAQGGDGFDQSPMGKALGAKYKTRQADNAFLVMAAQSDQNEIALSQLAVKMAAGAKVKRFANKMVTDHMMLSSVMKPYATEWDVKLPSGPDADHQAELDKLKGMSGPEFDKEYIRVMAADHHKALDAFKAQGASSAGKEFDAKVSKARALVASHTRMADDMANSMT